MKSLFNHYFGFNWTENGQKMDTIPILLNRLGGGVRLAKDIR
jgi:hypothetical protein